jgi:uncharacterized protein YidB (DUF937 family)
MPPVFPGAQANTIEELARQLGLDAERLAQTIATTMPPARRASSIIPALITARHPA